MLKKIAIEYNSTIFKDFTITDRFDELDEKTDEFLLDYDTYLIEVLPSDYYPGYDMVIRYEDDSIQEFINEFENFLTSNF